MKRLNQRVAVVTGAARGIGQAIAVAFAVEGARLVLVDLADLRETTSLISRTASRTRPQLMRADVSSEGDAASVAEHALAEFGRIDILVNNAGILR